MALRIGQRSAVVLLISVFVALAIAPYSSADFPIMDLGTLPGDAYSVAYSINDAGQVVGWSNNTATELHAFLWESGTMTGLGTLPGDTSSQAFGINNAGQVVGASLTSSTTHAFLWQNGTMTNLGALPGGLYSIAYGINDPGQVVGVGSVGSAGHAFLWQSGVMTDLGTFPGGTQSLASGINTAGQVVGYSSTSTSANHAFLWQNGTMTDLGTLPGDVHSLAYGINDAGQVVGYGLNSTFAFHAFLWQNNVMTALGALPGDLGSIAIGINDAGEVVGYSLSSFGQIHAFLWQNGVMTGLGALPGDSGGSGAIDINNAGQVVGGSIGAVTHAVLWTTGSPGLTAHASAQPSQAVVGTDITFTCAAVGGTPPYTFSWDFGDGTTGSGANTTHSYASAGTWTATCTVTDSASTTATSSVAVQIYAAPIHDVAITTASASPLAGVIGTPITIRATLQNQGTQSETFDVNASAGSILVGTVTVTNLSAGMSGDLSFTWDTSAATPGSYPIRVEAIPVAGETDLADNVFDDGTVVLSAGPPPITDLGTLPGDTQSIAYGINNADQVVGYSANSTNVYHAFLWQNGTMTDLGTLPGGLGSVAYGINDAGQIIGFSLIGPTPHAFLWENGLMTDLGTLPGGGSSFAEGINNAGQVVGQSANHAFLWQNGTMTDLGTLLGHTQSIAFDINEAGQVVGYSYNSSSVFGAFLWQNGVMTELENQALAYGINNAGQIVGVGGPIHALLWQSGTRTDLGTLPGDAYSYAYGIDDAGQVVGYGVNSTIGLHAFLWQNNVMTALGTLPGRTASIALDINNAGQVVGASGNGSTLHAVLWTTGTTGLIAQTSATPAATTVGLPVTFTCAAIGGTPPYTFSWDFGDGTTGSGASVMHSYASAGTWTATCTVADGAGSQTSSSTVVHASPSVTLALDHAAASPGTRLSFTATATGGSGGYRYHWMFGDGSEADGAAVSHAYGSPGQYTASVIVHDSVGGTVEGSVTMTVAYLVAMATESTASATTADTITFTATAVGGAGGPYTFVWHFGDGTMGSGASVSHRYQNPGEYTPSVTVIDAAQASNTSELPTITVQNPAPTVPSALQDLQGTAGDGRVTLTWHAPSSDGGSPIDASATMPGGPTFAGPAELRAFLLSRREQFVGTFAAGLLTYALGQAPRSNEVSVTPSAPPDTVKPTLAIASPTSGAIVTSPAVTISGTAADNAGVQKVELSTDGANWIVATGTTSWSATLTLQEGTNTISVRVTDTSGNSETKTITVTVQNANVSPLGNPVVLGGVAVGVIGVAAAIGLAIRARIIRRRGPPPARR